MAELARMSIAHDTTLEWLALSLTPGLGPTRSRRLVDLLGGIEGVFRASLTELEATGIPAVAAQSLGTGRSLELANDEQAKAAAAGVQVLTCDDPAYPACLRQIYDPPVVLYVRGSVAVISQPGIAMVGSREPTVYGVEIAERLACDLAARGLVVFSGLARGIDAASHRGAIAAKGKTVAVFGTGVDETYPKENRRIVDRLLALGGAVISEFPLGTSPTPQNFPIRNRIISGISVGVLVVEAAEYSGTRITSRLALEQNREVFAVPGSVMSPKSWGPHTLIKQGAKLVATWEDVWEELPADVRLTLEPKVPNESPGGQTASLFEDDKLGPHERKILAVLKCDEATQLDEVIERLEPDLSPSEIFVAMFELELAGRVKQLPGKNFVKSFSLTR